MNRFAKEDSPTIMKFDALSTSNKLKDEDNDNTFEWPIPLSLSIWLVVSSCFFLIPGIYAFSTRCYFYGVVSTITTINSVNHWRKAESGFRQNVDRVVATISFVIYLVTGLCFLRGLLLFALALPGVILIILCFHLSHKMAEAGSGRWIYFHFSFHVFVALEQLLVVYAMVQSGVSF